MNRFKLLSAATIDGNLPLVKKYFNINTIDPESGAPLLFTAIRFHRDAIVDFLFAQHMAASSLSSLRDFVGNTALTVAVEFKNTVAQNRLISLAPDLISAENNAKECPIFLAVKTGQKSTLLLLLSLGVSINSLDNKGNSLLHIASAYGYFDLVQLLLEHGVSSCIYNKDGWTAKDYAFNTDMLSFLTDGINAMVERRPINPRSSSAKSQSATRMDQRNMI